MINLITPPDILADGTAAILLFAVSPQDLELTIAAARNMSKDINIYLCGDSTDRDWITEAKFNSLKVFIRSEFPEIIKYLKEIDE